MAPWSLIGQRRRTSCVVSLHARVSSALSRGAHHFEAGGRKHRTAARLCDAFLGVDFTARPREIGAPTSIIVGGEDHLNGQRYAEILHRSILASELHVLDRAGLASCWEALAEFNRIALELLSWQG
jgi:pimeloyl-ACP methyl ester carboxylesterase